MGVPSPPQAEIFGIFNNVLGFKLWYGRGEKNPGVPSPPQAKKLVFSPPQAEIFGILTCETPKSNRKKCLYKYKITKVIDDKGEKVAALLKANTGHDDFGVEFDGDDVAITIPESMRFDTNAAMMKFRLVSVLRDSVEAAKVSFVEVHEERTPNPEHGEDGHDHDENCGHGEEE